MLTINKSLTNVGSVLGLLYWEDVPEFFSTALGLQSRAVAYTNQDRGHSFSQYGATRANAGK